MKKTKIYKFLVLCVIFVSGTVFSQQNYRIDHNEIKNGQIKFVNTESGSDYSVVNAEKGGSEERFKISMGFMPVDDFENDQPENSTSIRFRLLHPGFVSIKIYDNSGKTIDEIARSSFVAGNHEVKWNRSKFSKRIYYYSIVSAEFSKTEKIK